MTDLVLVAEPDRTPAGKIMYARCDYRDGVCSRCGYKARTPRDVELWGDKPRCLPRADLLSVRPGDLLVEYGRHELGTVIWRVAYLSMNFHGNGGGRWEARREVIFSDEAYTYDRDRKYPPMRKITTEEAIALVAELYEVRVSETRRAIDRARSEAIAELSGKGKARWRPF